MNLTDKQKRFCEEYLIDLNATQAASRAGYSKSTSRQIGSELLSKLDIQDYIKELQKEVSKNTKISIEWVVNRLKDISDRCMTAEPVMVWDDKANGYVESGEYKFDSTGANKATELLGKHLGAFEKDNRQKETIIQVPKVIISPE